MQNFLYIVGGVAAVGLAYAGWRAQQIAGMPIASEKAKEIAGAIREGAMAFLTREYRILAVFALVIAALLWIMTGPLATIAFVAGAFLSALAGNIGMRIATLANVRTAEGAQKGLQHGLVTAFASGSVMGVTVVSLGLLGVVVLYLIFGNENLNVLFNFGFGASAVALFARVGGGIYTKAADVGADLVGKVEQGIPEDDPRNPATIADNVGDNVGDVAGMGADLFESYCDALIAAMMIGLTVSAVYGDSSILYPLGIAAIGIVSSLIGIFFVRTDDEKKISAAMNKGTLIAGALTILGSWWLTDNLFGNLDLLWVVIIGLVSGASIGLITEYFTSNDKKPAQKIAEASKTGAATNIIEGLGLGMMSTAWPVLIVCAATLLAYDIAGFYGIAVAAVGMLATLGITLASDTYGPVADNAAGIAEMSGMGKETRERAEALDAVGNTTAAIGKGFAIGSAALTALALMVSYITIAEIDAISITEPLVMAGLFVGGMLPFVFSALSMQAVGASAMKMVEEVRRQFKEIPGIMEGTGKPEYGKCVDIATTAALRQMVMPAVLAIAVPVLIGYVFGSRALGGVLAGSIVTGFLMAVMQSNAGGAWDNAKKYIEAGNLGGKGSAVHKAAVVGDTVGDPFKDTSGPSLNILIKLMSIVALIIAPLIVG